MRPRSAKRNASESLIPTPAFILELRRKVGHDLLLLHGLIAVVVDDHGRVLLNRRADTGNWSIISGILEPGEQPDQAIVREVFEETGLHVRVERLVHVYMTPVITYPNGDRSQYLTVVYRCRPVGGEAVVNDDESLEVRFFPPDQLPPLRDDLLHSIRLALQTSCTSM